MFSLELFLRSNVQVNLLISSPLVSPPDTLSSCPLWVSPLSLYRSFSLSFLQIHPTLVNMQLNTNVEVFVFDLVLYHPEQPKFFKKTKTKRWVKSRPWHCISYSLSNITQSAQKETQTSWKTCVCQYPAVIAWLFADGQWRACRVWRFPLARSAYD